MTARWCHHCGDIYQVNVRVEHALRGTCAPLYAPRDGSVARRMLPAQREEIAAECKRLERMARCPACRRGLHRTPEGVLDV